MLKILKKSGFASLLEITIAAIIFVIAGIGIFTTIAMFRPQATGSTNRLKAAYIGKYMLDELRSGVDANTWNTPSSNLFWPTPGTKLRTITINSVDYTIEWFSFLVPGLNVIETRMNITYSE
ncbi:MAG: hypothetical protein HQL27_02255 [Candidatus Omnitrophica bacterium]|nr:hypothetical protein [Candidatus Omnitrophota bacterium]